MKLCRLLLRLCVVVLLAGRGAPMRGQEIQRPAVSTNPAVNDAFGTVRRRVAMPDRPYWRRVGDALSRLQHLEGAAYEDDSGAILLLGPPALKRGPYHLDDLVTALRAALYETERLGMTIDPHQRNPLGPIMVVRYFGGSQNTAVGWLMFECDRLLKCYTQGRDNFNHEPVIPEVPGFATMLQRYAAAGGQNDLWSRFWLTPDLKNADADQQPEKSNGYQPVVRVADDRKSMRLIHCRLYLRTETMRLVGGALKPAQDVKDPQAEQFAAHFNAHYGDFKARQPELARLQALCELVALAEWIEQLHVPLDLDFLRSYEPSVAVETPTETPAGTAELTQAIGGGAMRRLQIYGGVDLASHLFLAADDGSAARFGERARASQVEHRDQVGWQIDSKLGPRQVVVLPTLHTALEIQSQRPLAYVQLRRPKGDDELDGQRLPPKPADLAKSDRQSQVPRVQITLDDLDQMRASAVAPIARAVDVRHLAKSDRGTLVKAERVALPAMPDMVVGSARGPPDDRRGRSRDAAIPPAQAATSGLVAEAALAESGRPSVPADELNAGPNSPRGPPGGAIKGGETDSNHALAKSDRAQPQVRREPVPLGQATPSVAGLNETDVPLFSVSSERVSRVARESVPLVEQSDRNANLGLPVFATREIGPTFNLPRIVTRTSSRHERTVSVDGIPTSEVKVPDQVSLVSELGDVAIDFGEPRIDQVRGEIFLPPQPPAPDSVHGYYLRRNTLAFTDGTQVRFDKHGLPERLERVDGTKVEFHYTARQGSDLPALVSCQVVSSGEAAEAGEYLLTRFDRPVQRPPTTRAAVPTAVESPRLAKEDTPPPVVPATTVARQARVAHVPAEGDTWLLAVGVISVVLAAAWFVLRR